MSAEPNVITSRQAADMVRRAVWKHFVCADTLMLYDYWWGAPGFPHLPSTEEVAQEYPNACGWGTGMENCALSAAQALVGAVRRHQLAPDDHTDREARMLFQGIIRLFRSATDPGFLPRGVALDGVSHYPNSSADQYTVTLCALHAYSTSSLATALEREAVQGVWQNVLARWERDGWEDRREDGGQAMYGEMDRITADRASRLLAALLGGHAVTGDPHWHDVYRQKLEEQDCARLCTALPSAGDPLYVFDQNQFAWRLLYELEEDRHLRQRYADLMADTAEAVVERMLEYRHYSRDEHARLLGTSAWDWRTACEPPGEPSYHGAEYNARLRQLAPASAYEHQFVQTPVEAAHVLSLSEDLRHHEILREHLPALLSAPAWEDVALSWSIYDVESTYWTMVERGLAAGEASQATRSGSPR